MIVSFSFRFLRKGKITIFGMWEEKKIQGNEKK